MFHLREFYLRHARHFIDSNSINCEEQFGFHQFYNTILQILIVTELITVSFNNKILVGTTFLDLKKAFDTVWPVRLIYKMIQLRVSDWIIHVLHNYLCDWSFLEKCKNSIARHFPICVGIPWIPTHIWKWKAMEFLHFTKVSSFRLLFSISLLTTYRLTFYHTWHSLQMIQPSIAGNHDFKDFRKSLQILNSVVFFFNIWKFKISPD